MKALISPQENNRIVEVKQTEFPVATPLFWLDCPSNVTTDWTYTESGFNPPVNPVTPNTEVTEVSMRQARLALLQYSLLTAVNTAIANGNEADKIEWEYATTVVKSSPLVQNMVSYLGLSKEQLDNLFNVASTL